MTCRSALRGKNLSTLRKISRLVVQSPFSRLGFGSRLIKPIHWRKKMLMQLARKNIPAVFVILASLPGPALSAQVGPAVFSVKTYGATGKKADNARTAIQKAIDACAKAGGGTVYLPPGDYTSGTLHLRSHVRFYIASGAILFGAEQDSAF